MGFKTQIGVSDAIWKCLGKSGVEVVFGYPGGAVIPLYDAYAKDNHGIVHIRTSHEQGAAEICLNLTAGTNVRQIKKSVRKVKD